MMIKKLDGPSLFFSHFFEWFALVTNAFFTSCTCLWLSNLGYTNLSFHGFSWQTLCPCVLECNKILFNKTTTKFRCNKKTCLYKKRKIVKNLKLGYPYTYVYRTHKKYMYRIAIHIWNLIMLPILDILLTKQYNYYVIGLYVALHY